MVTAKYSAIRRGGRTSAPLPCVVKEVNCRKYRRPVQQVGHPGHGDRGGREAPACPLGCATLVVGTVVLHPGARRKGGTLWATVRSPRLRSWAGFRNPGPTTMA